MDKHRFGPEPVRGGKNLEGIPVNTSGKELQIFEATFESAQKVSTGALEHLADYPAKL